MSLIAERARSLYNRFFSVETMGKIMATVTPLLILKEHIGCYLKSLVPSYIERIVHFDTETGKTRAVYVAWKNMYSLKRSTYELLGLTKNGYYMIVLWNNIRQKYERIILRGELVERALEIRNISNIWMLRDFAAVLMLSNYVQYASIKSNSLLGITLNRRDVTKKLKPFMNSIHIENNVCPSALYMLLMYLEDDVVNVLDMKSSMCSYVDYDLNEVSVPYANEYLYPSGARPAEPCRPALYEDNPGKQDSEHSAPSEVEELHETPVGYVKDKDL